MAGNDGIPEKAKGVKLHMLNPKFQIQRFKFQGGLIQHGACSLGPGALKVISESMLFAIKCSISHP
jgi:hypothetical protein